MSVDVLTLLIVGGSVLVLVVVALALLNRSWGDFPDRAGAPPPVGPPAPGVSDQKYAAGESWSAFETDAEPGLIPITNPLVRRSAEQALEQGSDVSRYIVRQGDVLYFDFARIEDPQQRKMAYDVMRRVESGDRVDLRELMDMVRTLFHR